MQTVRKARTIALISGAVLLTGVVVATAAIPWLGLSERHQSNSTALATVTPSHVVKTPPRGARSGKDIPKSDDQHAVSTISLRDQLAGTWQLQKHGQRTITIVPDGTATAQVRLDLLGALLYGEELSMNLTWTLEDDILTQTITGGAPKQAVSRLIRDWGGRRRYRVLDVSAEGLILVEVNDDNDREVWTAVAVPDATDQ